MAFIHKLLERALTSLLVSFLIFFASFSFMTGRFPPRKEDMQKAFILGKEIFFSTKEYNANVQSLQGRPPTLEQMIEIQKLALKRSEVTLNLQKIFTRIPSGAPNLAISQKLEEASNHLSQAEQGILEINEGLKVVMEEK